MEPPPLYIVSIRLMAYNHSEFIRQAMDGILMQKTSFPIEVVVGDDFSTDNTLEILKTYSNTENIHINILDRPFKGEYWQKRQELGRLYNFQNIIENCTGKYIALLDGDDYWTDPLKLQKQVDFLEQNPDYIMCGAKWKILRNDQIKPDTTLEENTSKNDFDTKNFLSIDYSPIHTSTVLIKNIFNTISFPWETFVKMPMGDIPLYFLLSLQGKTHRLPDYVSIYNKQNENSVTLTRTLQSIETGLINLLDFFNTYSNNKYQKEINAEKTYIRSTLKYKTKTHNTVQAFFYLVKYRKKLAYSFRDILYIVRNYHKS